MSDLHPVVINVNGQGIERTVEARRLLADFLRDELGLTGTHVGCEHGVCGTCTVLLDGQPIRSCLSLAVQANGRRVTTVEGVSPPEGLHPIQQAFWDMHALQCGFCTPGFVVTLFGLLKERPDATDAEVDAAIGGVLCRCTGYQNIRRAALRSRDIAANEARIGK